MKPPADTDLCFNCEHTWAEHQDGDAAEAWKTDCGCCRSGMFLDGREIVVDDLDEGQMEAWCDFVRGRRRNQ
jgi:hypothetical protein